MEEELKIRIEELESRVAALEFVNECDPVAKYIWIHYNQIDVNINDTTKYNVYDNESNYTISYNYFERYGYIKNGDTEVYSGSCDPFRFINYIKEFVVIKEEE